MFNHFFFDRPDGEQVLRDFLCQAPGEQVVPLMDPPFGGLVEVHAVTVKRIWDTWKDVNKGKLFLLGKLEHTLGLDTINGITVTNVTNIVLQLLGLKLPWQSQIVTILYSNIISGGEMWLIFFPDFESCTPTGSNCTLIEHKQDILFRKSCSLHGTIFLYQSSMELWMSVTGTPLNPSVSDWSKAPDRNWIENEWICVFMRISFCVMSYTVFQFHPRNIPEECRNYSVSCC